MQKNYRMLSIATSIIVAINLYFCEFLSFYVLFTLVRKKAKT